MGGEDVGEDGSPITRAFETWLSMGPDAEDAEETEEAERDEAAPVTVVPEGAEVPDAKAADVPHAKAVPAGRTTDAAFAAWLESAEKKSGKSPGKETPAPDKTETNETAATEKVVMREATGE